MSGGKRRVTYFYEPSIGDYEYAEGHVMKPHRIRMTHNLVVQYGLHNRMEIVRPYLAGASDFGRFHSPEYIKFLAKTSSQTVLSREMSKKAKGFNLLSNDCPGFKGMFDFSGASAGGSIGAAVKLGGGEADIAINWAGGLHHAKKEMASGFCYVNDIVLGILELLKRFTRVLYIDIDVHHGDGVEEAFYHTNRVMTVSFHQYGGGFFPETGHIRDSGTGEGTNYSLNIPLKAGMDDAAFKSLFRPVIQKVLEVYLPEAIVLQCGADSLSGDELGEFNLSVKGHADCLRFLRSYNIPLMVLGGGGYTVPNVARCWCYETAVAVGEELDDNLPYTEYFDYFGPEYTLHVKPSPRENLNEPEHLEMIRNVLLQQLSGLIHAPSVPFEDTPPVNQIVEEPEEDMDTR